MNPVAKSLKNILPDEIRDRATRIVINQAGEKTVIQDRFGDGDPTDSPDSITISYTIPLESAVNYFEMLHNMKQLTKKAKL
jgi:hypothetical protein